MPLGINAPRDQCPYGDQCAMGSMYRGINAPAINTHEINGPGINALWDQCSYDKSPRDESPVYYIIRTVFDKDMLCAWVLCIIGRMNASVYDV